MGVVVGSRGGTRTLIAAKIVAASTWSYRFSFLQATPTSGSLCALDRYRAQQGRAEKATQGDPK